MEPIGGLCPIKEPTNVCCKKEFADAGVDKWDAENAYSFPRLGFKYGWETLPFGMNGGSYYVRLDYRF